MNIPRGYKQTELGIIPEDWEVVTIDDVLSMATKTISTSSFDHKFYIGTENMLSEKRGVSPYSGTFPYLQVREYLTYDILTSNIRPYLKKIWLADRCGGCSSDVIVFRVKDTNTICPAYIYTIISDDSFFRYSMDSAIGTKMPRGDKSAIKTYSFAIPQSLSEQKAIAKALSDVDDLIAALDKKIAKKRLIKQGAMQQLLTSKKRLPGFTEEWVLTTLSQLGRFISGNGFPICFQGCKSEKYPFFKVSDFSNKGNELSLTTANNYISESIKDKLCCNIIPKKSIIFAKIGAAIFLERKRLCDVDCCIDNNMMAFHSNTDTDANFICFLLQSFSFGDLVEATALPSLGARTVGNIILYIPKNIKEQQSIAAILSDMDKEIASLEKQRYNYCLLKSGMMQKLLTGQIRLKTK